MAAIRWFKYKIVSLVIFAASIYSMYFIYNSMLDIRYQLKPFNGLIDCNLLIQNNHLQLIKAIQMKRSNFTPVNQVYKFLPLLQDETSRQENCLRYKQSRGYILSQIPTEESQFKIAFSIVMHKDFVMFEKLFRMIYRPQNIYCVHVDGKSSPTILKRVKALFSCFPNAHLVSDSVRVNWGDYSILEAELNCMKDLLTIDSQWKYLINLAGQEFPLKTNWELVQILKVFNGANNVEGTFYTQKGRYPKTKLSFPIQWIKGSLRITASRPFIDFAINNNQAKEILNALKDHSKKNGKTIPDEMFFSTLNNNPKHLPAPGSNLGPIKTSQFTNQFVSRFVRWVYSGPQKCPSKKLVRGVCIMGVNDLPILVNLRELFVNKFYSDFQPAAINCFEEWLYNRTLDQYVSSRTGLDLSYYKNLTFVLHHR